MGGSCGASVTLLIGCLIICCWCCVDVNGCVEEERRALLDIKHSLDSVDYDYSMLEDWVGGGDCCNWSRVECDALSYPYRAVSGIDLSFVRNGFSQEWYPNGSLFGQFTKLKKLDLGFNGIAGWVNPQDIWHLQKVQLLHLARNNFNDEIIAQLIVPWIHNLTSLSELDLGGNNLKEIRWISNLTSLRSLKLVNTQIKDISGFWGVQNLEYLYLSSNQIESVGSWIFNITSAQEIDLSFNTIKDLPSGFWGVQNLEYLSLSSNQMESVGSWIFNITSARSIYLSFNMIKDLPSDLCQLQDLQFLDLSENSMKGNIDTCLKKNNFEGPVPTQVCHMRLHILDLSNNYLSGTIPSCLNNITSWIIDSPIDYSLFSVNGYINKAINFDTVLSSLSTKDLSKNQFSGPIPFQMGNLCALHSLNLSNNHLTGPIPDSFQNLENIESLDLSNNHLSGEIPSQLVQLHSLSVFRVSYNNLSGIIPYKDQFCTFNKSSFEGNPDLSEELIEKNCWSMHVTSQTYNVSNNGDHEGTSKVIDNDVIFYSFIAASFAIGFWGVIAVLAFNKNGRIKFFMAADDFLYACMDVILGLIKRIEKCIC
ncbi:hypothetical protein QJS10_CPB19g01280 [Acorus calamus]|uniref:Leucine-rich repeat-containing N-terminal plant-type domain-containing protein n=1 Tax=Acorus calamus TaxID=4465 RepID=A0AAV9CIK3_ACOCL|nr:hypothetical protein QJS10_CPB19g01280 [Acorus calamus]